VPKWYRKATKVMARAIELAVVAADLAARDAKLVTKAASRAAKSAATTANSMARAMTFVALRYHLGTNLLILKSLTSTPIEQSNPVASNALIGPIAQRPDAKVSHVGPIPSPSPLTGPKPLMTTLLDISPPVYALADSA